MTNELAFPFQSDESSSKNEAHYGLTKREHFAAMAMQGMLAGRDPQYDYDFEDIARWSVENADALLKQLQNE